MVSTVVVCTRLYQLVHRVAKFFQTGPIRKLQAIRVTIFVILSIPLSSLFKTKLIGLFELLAMSKRQKRDVIKDDLKVDIL